MDKVTIEIWYKVYEFRNGLLLEPNLSCGFYQFSKHGYESFEDAVEAVKIVNPYGNYVILPVASPAPTGEE